MDDGVTTKHGRVHDAILRKAFSDDVQGGDRLVERELAKELGVSRIPVRDALTKLVARGILVGGEKGQGAFVRRYSPDDVRQLYEYREMLEGGAAMAAARSAIDSDLLRMSMICDEMAAQADQFESARWRELDRKFHVTMAESGRNQRVINALEPLLIECFFMFYAPSEAGVDETDEVRGAIPVRVVQEHREVLRLIQRRDAAGAEKAVREHICWVGDLANRLAIAAELKA